MTAVHRCSKALGRLVLFLLAAGAAAGPQGSRPTSPRYLGTARPAGTPKRVVSLAPSLTEILFALDRGDRVVGVTTYDDYPEEVERLPRVGGFVDPSVEAVLGLAPDLVVCVPNPGGRNRMEVLDRLGIAVLVLPARSLEDIYAAVHTLGEVFDCGNKASELVAGMQARIRHVRTRVGGLPRPRVLLVYGHKPVIAAGPDTFADDLLRLAGGRNVLTGKGVRYPTVPMEQVIRLAPAVIVDASASGKGAEMTPAEVQQVWRRWKVVPAVRGERVHVFDSAIWFRPGPRVVEGIERLAAILHPEKTHEEGTTVD